MYPSPSGSHTSRELRPAQRALPGAQMRSRHIPSRQLWLLVHGAASYALPCVLHASCAPAIVQRVAPGVQTRGRQRFSGPQNCVSIMQSLSPTQSTQRLCAVSHTCIRSLHWRDDVHARGRATQLFSRHCCVEGQSTSVEQSTHDPRVMSHTWPGHWRDDVHATAATQCCCVHDWLALGQSLRVRHSTQTPRSRSHTPPDDMHSLLERHALEASGVASAVTSALASAVTSAITSGRASAVASRAASRLASPGVTGTSAPQSIRHAEASVDASFGPRFRLGPQPARTSADRKTRREAPQLKRMNEAPTPMNRGCTRLPQGRSESFHN